MKNTVTIPQFSFKINTAVLVVIIIMLAGFVYYLNNENSKSDSIIQQKEQENKILDSLNIENAKKVKLIEIEKEKLTVKIDSFHKIDSLRVLQLNKISYKYEKLKANYSNASSSDKWKLFTEIINN